MTTQQMLNQLGKRPISYHRKLEQTMIPQEWLEYLLKKEGD